VAPYWRIRTGIKQGDTSLCTEINLALALQAYGVRDVDFETIWNQGHTQAEDTGDGTDNFIEWVQQCCQSYTSGLSKVTAPAISGKCYDLTGRPVTGAYKGIVIKDGKKVVN